MLEGELYNGENAILTVPAPQAMRKMTHVLLHIEIRRWMKGISLTTLNSRHMGSGCGCIKPSAT